MEPTLALLKALSFAAEKHRHQRRKDSKASPYINHLIQVAELLANTGGVTDVPLLTAAILHDTIEDTATTAQELDRQFGGEVRRLVEEVTDDKSLSKEERKRLQIEHAPHLSPRAKQLKLADKISNVRDVGFDPPANWNPTRRAEYLEWARQVAAGCRGVNPALEALFDRTLAEAKAVLAEASDANKQEFSI